MSVPCVGECISSSSSSSMNFESSSISASPSVGCEELVRRELLGGAVESVPLDRRRRFCGGSCVLAEVASVTVCSLLERMLKQHSRISKRDVSLALLSTMSIEDHPSGSNPSANSGSKSEIARMNVSGHSKNSDCCLFGLNHMMRIFFLSPTSEPMEGISKAGPGIMN